MPSAPATALVCVVGGNSVTTAMVLACLNTVDASILRRLHPAMAAAVEEVPWADMETIVTDVVRWRAALPAAVGMRPAAMPTEHGAVLARVTSLDLSLADGITKSSLAALPSSLRSLSVRAEVDLGTVSFTHLPALESLTWGPSGWSVSHVSRVGELPPSLRELRINNCLLPPDADFSHLRSLRLLYYAGEWCELSADAIASLPPSLEELDVSYRGYRRFLNPEKVGAWPPGASLSHLPHLRVLRAVRRAIDDAIVATLPPSLTELDVSDTNTLTPAVSFAHLTRLHTLNLRETRLSDAALATLPPSLVSLDVSECYRLTAAAVLPALPALRVLAVNQTHLGDAAIASMPVGLEELRMVDCKDVTQRAATVHLTALRVLHSAGTTLPRTVLAACHARGGYTVPADSVLRGGGDDHVTAMALLPDGRLVATEYGPGAAAWDVEYSSTPATSAVIGGARILALVALPDGHVVMGVRWRDHGGGGVVVWDTNSSTRFDVSAAIDECHGVRALAALPDGRVATGSIVGGLQVLDVGTRAVVATIKKKFKKGYITALAVLPDGTLASAITNNHKVSLWDVGARTRVAALVGHTKDVCALVVLPSGLLASGSDDATARLWDTARRTCVSVLTGHRGSVTALAALLDGRLAVASGEGSVRVWDTRGAASTATGETPVVTVTEGLRSAPMAMLALPDGRLATGSRGCIRLWQLPRAL